MEFTPHHAGICEPEWLHAARGRSGAVRSNVLLYQEPATLVPSSRGGMPRGPSLLSDLLAAESVAERRRTVSAVLHAIGFEWLAYGRLMSHGDRAEPISMCVTHTDSAWAQHYFSQNYHEVDPRLRDALQSSLPCSWTIERLDEEARKSPSPSALRRFVADLADTGMRAGALLVLPGPAGTERHFVSLLTRTPSSGWMDGALLGQVLTLGLCVHEFSTRYTEVPVTASTAPTLTPIQREILELVAQGASDKQIAYELHLSSHAVDYHMRQLRRRFAVRNRVQLTQAATRADATDSRPADLDLIP
jgi:DNA-binding CsgD family transcriptional regulator